MTTASLSLRVTTAGQADACDQRAIAHGTPSFTLMLRAGTRTAECLLRHAADRLAHGVVVYAGSGNNGGDAYVVAAQLARAGVRVRVVACGEPRTDDARRAAALAAEFAAASGTARLSFGPASGHERVAIDGVLGTGHRGEFRESVRDIVQQLRQSRARGAQVWALDVPSGLDATTGDVADGLVPADVTTTYGTVKRGALSARDVVGRLMLLDIGLTMSQVPSEVWQLASDSDIAMRVPPIPWNAHKGTRGTVGIVGGSEGMAGAVILAAQGALASGAGLVRARVESAGVSALQQAVPHAIAQRWVDARESAAGHALVIGPGLGQRDEARRAMRDALKAAPDAAVVLDADALNLIAVEGGDVAARVREWCGARTCILTPHPAEFARLSGCDARSHWTERVVAAQAFSRAAQATIVLKGTPTVVVHAHGEVDRVAVVPRGSAVLATGGSGDVLSGILGALLSHRATAFDAALIGATVHGRAAELVATASHAIRGRTIADIVDALPQAWDVIAAGRHAPFATPSVGVLAEWPSLA